MNDFEHENVLKVIGFSINSSLVPTIILPLMTLGDLLTYIRNPQVYITNTMVNGLHLPRRHNERFRQLNS